MQIHSVVFALSLQIKQAKGMRKQLISFVQVINFFVKYHAQGFFNPNPLLLRTPLRRIMAEVRTRKFKARFSENYCPRKVKSTLSRHKHRVLH